MRSAEETAPAPLLESPEPVLVEILAKADRLPLAPADPTAILAKAFADQAPVPTPAELVAESQPRNSIAIQLRATRPTDVCTRHGMRKQITRGGRSWRCRR
jgi:hypothetical protein